MSSSGLIPGVPTAISEGVWRVLAPNPGMMTGPGTNSYLLALPHGLAVLDPGPADSQHAAALLAAAEQLGQPLVAVIVTHTHRDHSPAAQLLGDLHCHGPLAPDDGLQDEAWQPDTLVEDGYRLALADGRHLRAIATPGHVSNHFCYLVEETGVLFSGDHLIQGSTVVVAPPAGSMSAYLRSLARLQSEPLSLLAPGHGDVVSHPQDYIEYTLGHRQRREDKVVRMLREQPGSTVAELVTTVYDDTPVFLHSVASLSLTAHLIKLQEEQRAELVADRWTLC